MLKIKERNIGMTPSLEFWTYTQKTSKLLVWIKGCYKIFTIMHKLLIIRKLFIQERCIEVAKNKLFSSNRSCTDTSGHS